jgi:hypothetical protein
LPSDEHPTLFFRHHFSSSSSFFLLFGRHPTPATAFFATNQLPGLLPTGGVARFNASPKSAATKPREKGGRGSHWKTAGQSSSQQRIDDWGNDFEFNKYFLALWQPKAWKNR